MASNTVIVVQPKIQTVTIASKGIQGIRGEPSETSYSSVLSPLLKSEDIIPIISIPQATNVSDGYATSSHIQAIEANTEKLSYVDAAKVANYPEMPIIPSNGYLADDGTFKPVAVGSGSYAANLYLSNDDSITPGYKRLSYIPDTNEVIKSITAQNNTVHGEKYLFDVEIGINVINAGNWIKSISRQVNAVIWVSTYQIRMFMYTLGGVENDLFTITSSEVNNGIFTPTKTEIIKPQFSCNITDRFGIQISFTTTNTVPVIFSYIVGDGSSAFLLTPLALRHTSIRNVNEDPEVQHMTSTEKIAIEKLQISPSGTKPPASISTSGMIWRNIGGAGVADTVEICLKDTSDIYSWFSLI